MTTKPIDNCTQMGLFAEEQIEEVDGPHDELIARIIGMAEEIKKLPLGPRAAICTIVEVELDKVVEDTFQKLKQKPSLLQAWAVWSEAVYPLHFGKKAS